MKAIVIGVGVMGQNHARIYSELKDVHLAAVVDVNKENAEKVADAFGVRAYDDFITALEKEQPDIASIVVPTFLHFEVACAAIVRGVNVLVEKPIASTLIEAQQMIQLAEKHNVTLTVGHIERFNPAIIELKQRLESGQLGRIFKIHARRLGPFPSRIRDVGVVFDLATHDLDVMRSLVCQPALRIYAETKRRIHKQHEDLLMGLLTFTDGTVGILDINWLTPTKIRELIVTGEKGMFVANYLMQELYFYKNSFVGANLDSIGHLDGVSEGDMIKFRIDQREPLKEELRSFVHCVAENRPPYVTGLDGLEALNLAGKLIESSLLHQSVNLLNGENHQLNGENNHENRSYWLGQDRPAVSSSIRV